MACSCCGSLLFEQQPRKHALIAVARIQYSAKKPAKMHHLTISWKARPSSRIPIQYRSRKRCAAQYRCAMLCSASSVGRATAGSIIGLYLKFW